MYVEYFFFCAYDMSHKKLDSYSHQQQSFYVLDAYCKAMYQVQTNHPDDATVTLNKLLSEKSTTVGSRDDASTHLRGLVLELRARALTCLNCVRDAVNDLNHAEELLDHLSTESLLLRAWLFRRLNEPVQAINDLNNLIQRQPNMYVAYLRRARLRFECGQFRAAKSDLKSVLSLSIFEVESSKNSSEENEDTSRFVNRNGQDADEIYETCGLDPFDCCMLMGHIYMKLKQHNKAMESYIRASRWRLNRPEGYLYHGITLQRRKEHKKALKSLCTAERLLDAAEKFEGVDNTKGDCDDSKVDDTDHNQDRESKEITKEDEIVETKKEEEESKEITKTVEIVEKKEEDTVNHMNHSEGAKKDDKLEEEKVEDSKEMESQKNNTEQVDENGNTEDSKEEEDIATQAEDVTLDFNEEKLIDTNCIEEELSKSSFIKSNRNKKSEQKENERDSNVKVNTTRRDILRRSDIRYCDELRRRLFLRRQMTYCELGKMKLARSDWNKTAQLDRKCNRIQESERNNTSAPDQDDLFIFSFGEIERPRVCDASWKPRTNLNHKVMVSQSKIFWKNYMKNSAQNREMRKFASAISMQRIVRGHLDRMVVKRIVQANRLQAWYRGAHVRRVHKLNQCATCIQALCRGYRGRRDMARRSRLALAVDTVRHHVQC